MKLRYKRKHLEGGNGFEDEEQLNESQEKNYYLVMEQMRINAEKERLKQFKEIISNGGVLYYRVC
eukprot:CAMPEP_0170566152 /NCGR_PEP_ID=MMETSP0211-20121228/79655_1 /TAXON_ID=311385 /ORGANISM="Pseudokeronopsis sp., Strain OXSARD2" /LENGTH=64 /DNA_ID=CAMNT_0010887245 /DNA_START=882 /DNA_END=1076 /DNA_ORIENTATION=-